MGARALIAAVFAGACAGPVPSAEVVSVAASPDPGHERVVLEVRNDGRHGEITVEVTLAAARGGVLREVRTVEMDAHERLQLTIDIAAPAGEYTATVAAKYPK